MERGEERDEARDDAQQASGDETTTSASSSRLEERREEGFFDFSRRLIDMCRIVGSSFSFLYSCEEEMEQEEKSM